jgi:hypothetical protein
MSEEIFEQRINLEELNKAMLDLQTAIKKIIVWPGTIWCV